MNPGVCFAGKSRGVWLPDLANAEERKRGRYKEHGTSDDQSNVHARHKSAAQDRKRNVTAKLCSRRLQSLAVKRTRAAGGDEEPGSWL